MLYISGNPPGLESCYLQRNECSVATSESLEGCDSVNMKSFPLNKPLFEVNINCKVQEIKIFISGIDCGAAVSYGPYIGGIHLVEMAQTNAQQCRLPFIQHQMAYGKCRVSIEYPDIAKRGSVLLQARLRYNEDKNITICKNNIMYSCM